MITVNDVTEHEVHNFVAFASDLYDSVPELRKGFPRVIQTNLGNGQPLIGYSKKISADGDLQYVRYRQQLGCIEVKIFND